MGSGKSTCGRLLAERLGWHFTDLDHAITQEQELPVAQIFARHGEAGFREMERQKLLQVLQTPRTVIALGGGTWIDAASREAIRKVAATIWLQAPAGELWRRSQTGEERPLRGSETEFASLLETRLSRYSEAEFTVHTQSKTEAMVVEEILNLLKGDLWLEA